MATKRRLGPLRREGRLRWILVSVVSLVLATGWTVATGPSWPTPRARTPASPTAAAVASATTAESPSRPPSPTAGSPAPPPPTATPAPRLLREECRPGAGDFLARADALLANRYTFTFFPAVDLPADPRWDENPLGSRNWEFQYHTLRFVWDLTAAFEQTADPKYLERARFLLRDWVRDNPRRGSRSALAWSDHAVAWRAVVLVCVAELMRDEPWLGTAIALHGRTLADRAFYVGHGNHALNQNVGLLEVGCHLGRRDWMRLAAARLAELVTESVDDEGVTNEQAVFYQYYNWFNYQRARRRLAACNVLEPPSLARIDRMPEFLAHATLPNGEYVMLGDSGRRRASIVPGTPAEFAATLGASGPRPDSRFALFEAGFAFGRTGWGGERPFVDEVAWSARFGPGRKWHGHADGLSVTLYGYGSRLVEDPGLFTYNHDRWRAFAIGRSAHNVVTVDGLAYDPSRATQLVASSTAPTCDYLSLRNRGVAGVDHQRRIVFSPRLGYVIVDDALTSARRHTYRQLWHLVVGGDPLVEDTIAHTRRDHGNVTIAQLVDGGTQRIVVGRENPVQGWFSHHVDDWVPAPVVEVIQSGRSVRYLTLLLPSVDRDPRFEVSDLEVTGAGFSLTISVEGITERVTVDGGAASVLAVG